MEGEKVIIKKVKSGGHEGSHGGSWKVAYADFVTAMMAFFLLMWLLGALKPQQKVGVATYMKQYNVMKGTSAIKEKIDKEIKLIFDQEGKGAKGEMGIVDTGLSGTGAGERLMKAVKAEIEMKLSDVQNQVLVDSVDNTVRVQLVDAEGNLMFPSGSAELTPTAKKILQVIADKLKDSAVKIAIEGHTDAYRYNTGGLTNWELSTMRASAARRELELNGFNPDHLVKVAGYADTVPLVGDNPFDPRNRRISLLLYYK